MPLHIETELAAIKDRAKALSARIAQREACIDELTKEASEAQRLHGDALKQQREELSGLQEVISKQEAAIAEMKANEEKAKKPEVQKA